MIEKLASSSSNRPSLINCCFKGKLVLLHGVRSRKSLYHEEEYRSFMKKHPEFEYIPVLAEPSLEDGWIGKTGLVTKALTEWLNSNKIELTSAEAFLCGPSAMMEAASKILTQNGISEDKIYSDPFSF